jgi:hypothetical protein
VIPTNEKGQRLMSREIEGNQEVLEKLQSASLSKADIQRCLMLGKRLVDHVIEFERYAAAWMEIDGPQGALRIHNSVLWSFQNRGMNLSLLARRRQRQWKRPKRDHRSN